MIIIEPCAGLGNRFLGLASAYHMSRKLNEKLLVIWKKETALGAPSDLLFTLPQDVEVVQISELGYKRAPFAEIAGNRVKKKYRKLAGGMLTCDDVHEMYQKGGTKAIEDYIKGRENAYLKATNPFVELDSIEKPLDFIKPAAAITQKVEQILHNVDRENLVGIHVRRTDNRDAINNSPLSGFMDKMKREVEKNPNVHFYLATDDREVENEITAEFGDRIYTFKDKSLARDDNQGIIDAYTEMLCLSRCSKIIGSFNSTYSAMAARIGGIKLEI